MLKTDQGFGINFRCTEFERTGHKASQCKLCPEETPQVNTPPKNSNGEQDTGGNTNSTILSEAPKIDQQPSVTNSSTGGNSSKRTVNEILTPPEENPTDNPFVTPHPIEKQNKIQINQVQPRFTPAG
ncbi:hypothetical protein JTB14_023918 [Gonioctena quinquepunctata]|nr:hypothetical protein JTB14_023918 [Gonioctena quinquepunctata]